MAPRLKKRPSELPPDPADETETYQFQKQDGKRGTEAESHLRAERAYQLYSQGYSPTIIARTLSISRQTVYDYIRKLQEELISERDSSKDLEETLESIRLARNEAWGSLNQWERSFDQIEEAAAAKLAILRRNHEKRTAHLPEAERPEFEPPFDYSKILRIRESKNKAVLMGEVVKIEEFRAKILGLIQKAGGNEDKVSGSMEIAALKIQEILSTPTMVLEYPEADPPDPEFTDYQNDSRLG